MPPLLKPGFRFKEGRLLIFTEEEALALDLWPELKARRKKSSASQWTPFTPIFRLLRPKRDASIGPAQGNLASVMLGPRNLANSALDPELERRRAFDMFRFALPTKIATAVERFPSRQWRLLRVVNVEPSFLDLTIQNPALSFCVANHDALVACSDGPVSRAAQMSGLKQREILRWLRFPDTDACAKIFAKMLPEATHIRGVKRMMAAWKTEAGGKLLAHAPSINAGVVELVVDSRLRDSVTPKLLAEVAGMASENERSELATLLGDFQLMSEALHPDKPPKVFQSVAKLREAHQEIGIEYCKHQDSAHLECRFPLPPLLGTKEIIPLLNPNELAAEGKHQQNCVRTYAKWVEAGTFFIYKVLRPERATLGISKGPDGAWQIHQLVLANNQPVSTDTWHFVANWLREYSFSV